MLTTMFACSGAGLRTRSPAFGALVLTLALTLDGGHAEYLPPSSFEGAGPVRSLAQAWRMHNERARLAVDGPGLPRWRRPPAAPPPGVILGSLSDWGAILRLLRSSTRRCPALEYPCALWGHGA